MAKALKQSTPVKKSKQAVTVKNETSTGTKSVSASSKSTKNSPVLMNKVKHDTAKG